MAHSYTTKPPRSVSGFHEEVEKVSASEPRRERVRCRFPGKSIIVLEKVGWRWSRWLHWRCYGRKIIISPNAQRVRKTRADQVIPAKSSARLWEWKTKTIRVNQCCDKKCREEKKCYIRDTDGDLLVQKEKTINNKRFRLLSEDGYFEKQQRTLMFCFSWIVRFKVCSSHCHFHRSPRCSYTVCVISSNRTRLVRFLKIFISFVTA